MTSWAVISAGSWRAEMEEALLRRNVSRQQDHCQRRTRDGQEQRLGPKPGTDFEVRVPVELQRTSPKPGGRS